MEKRKTIAQMIGEFLRELAVLVAVFDLIETLIHAKSLSEISVCRVLWFFVVTALALFFGVLIERVRQEEA